MIVLADANLEVALQRGCLGRLHELWTGLPLRGAVVLFEQTAVEKFIALCVEKTKTAASRAGK